MSKENMIRATKACIECLQGLFTEQFKSLMCYSDLIYINMFQL